MNVTELSILDPWAFVDEINKYLKVFVLKREHYIMVKHGGEIYYNISTFNLYGSWNELVSFPPDTSQATCATEVFNLEAELLRVIANVEASLNNSNLTSN